MLPVDYDNFKAALQIDRDSLDEVVQQQSTLLHECMERHVLAASLRDDKKDELARRDATIAREYRTQCEASSKKATDASVYDYVVTHEDHVRLLKEFSALKRECDLWFTLRESFSDRSYMIRQLVDLHQSDFYATTSAGSSRGAVRDAMADSAKAKLEEARRERGKK